MKRLLTVLAMAILMTSALAAQSGTSEKVIKDPTEYNAYVTALNLTDPAAKGAAFENFVQKYPNSVVKEDALEQAMAGYQQAGNSDAVGRMASALLQINGSNVRALAVHVALSRAQAVPATAAEVRTGAVKGLQLLDSWKKPDGVTDAQFQVLRDQMTAIFAGACGFGALQVKDYPAARDCYLKSLAVDPKNLQDTYQLSVALLEMKPPDPLGLWYVAKAIDLANGNPTAQKSITDYGRSRYVKLHGNAEGWEQLLAQAAGESYPPTGFRVAPPPTPAEIAVKAVAENDPATLSITDWEYVLSFRDASPANRDAAEKVWSAVQAKQKNGKARLKLPAMVISATATTIEAAITDENQQAKRADLIVSLRQAMQNPPKAGAMIDVVGVISAYTPQPFHFTMTESEVAAPPAAK